MRIGMRLMGCWVLWGCAGCSDFFNRTYHYQEEIPLKPFVIKLVKTEHGNVDGKLALKVSLAITNQSPEKNNLSRNRFVLRREDGSEIARDSTFLEALGIETISFAPGESATVTVPFMLPREALNERLALIVDRPEKNGKSQWTLVELKNRSRPDHPSADGEWRTARSARWD